MFIVDLSIPYWEIDHKVEPRSSITRACVVLGACKVFCDFMAQGYAFFLAILIKKILKDPIHKLHGQIILSHVVTIIVAIILTFSITINHEFGVEVYSN